MKLSRKKIKKIKKRGLKNTSGTILNKKNKFQSLKSILMRSLRRNSKSSASIIIKKAIIEIIIKSPKNKY